MKYSVKVDNRLNNIAVFRTSDECETNSCGVGCDDFVGGFSYEQTNDDMLIHSWDFRDYDWRAAKLAADFFLLRVCRANKVETVFVERSEADRFWMNLGWDAVGKCEYLERYIGDSVCI